MVNEYGDVYKRQGVEFVRYGMLTVVPFPFKYLREYIVKKEQL